MTEIYLNMITTVVLLLLTRWLSRTSSLPQLYYYDRNAGPELPELEDGEEIHVRRGKQWKPAKVIRKSDVRSYQIQPEDGQEIRRNRRYLLRSHHP